MPRIVSSSLHHAHTCILTETCTRLQTRQLASRTWQCTCTHSHQQLHSFRHREAPPRSPSHGRGERPVRTHQLRMWLQILREGNSSWAPAEVPYRGRGTGSTRMAYHTLIRSATVAVTAASVADVRQPWSYRRRRASRSDSMSVRMSPAANGCF